MVPSEERLSALDFIRKNQLRIRGLFRQFEVIGTRAHEMKQGVVNELFAELEIHCAVIDTMFYPLLRNVLDASGASDVQASYDAHQGWLRAVRRLRGLRVDDGRFDGLLRELICDIDLHFEENEMRLLAWAKEDIPGAELDDLGRRMNAEREDLFHQDKYRAARSEIVQNPHGGEQKRKNFAA